MSDEMVDYSRADALRLCERAIEAAQEVRSMVLEGGRLLDAKRPWWARLLGIRRSRGVAHLDHCLEKFYGFHNTASRSNKDVSMGRNIKEAMESWIELRDQLHGRQSSAYRS